MKYVCDLCGRVVDEDEMRSHSESIGTCHGTPMSEERIDDCYCGGTFVKGIRCVICGEWFTEEELYGGICGECLKEQATPENVLGFYSIEANEDEIGNPFFKEMYGHKGLCEIVRKDIADRLQSDDEKDKYNIRHAALRAYIMADKDEFADYIYNKLITKKQEAKL